MQEKDLRVVGCPLVLVSSSREHSQFLAKCVVMVPVAILAVLMMAMSVPGVSYDASCSGNGLVMDVDDLGGVEMERWSMFMVSASRNIRMAIRSACL